MSTDSLDHSHLDQKYFIDTDVYNCPFCNRRNVQYVVSTYNRFNWTVDKTCYFIIVRCLSCTNASLHLSYNPNLIHVSAPASNRVSYKFRDDIEDIDSEVFYSVPTSFFIVDTRVPRVIRELITEAEGCLKMNYLTGASACMRKAIYELLVKENAEGKSYEEKIRYLKAKFDNIDSVLFDILGHIQQMTSNKIHEQSWDKWDSPRIRLITETLKTILNEIYVVPDERMKRIKNIQDLRNSVLQNQSTPGV